MRDQVARHLERARLAARVAVIGTVTEVRAGGHRTGAHDGEDPSRPRHRHRRSTPPSSALPRRAPGSRGDDRQPGRQCLQVGASRAVAVEALSEKPDASRRASRRYASSSMTTGPGLSPPAARAGRAPRTAARRDQAGLGARPVDRDRARASLYGGGLTLGTAPIGGLRAELVLPAV